MHGHGSFLQGDVIHEIYSFVRDTTACQVDMLYGREPAQVKQSIIGDFPALPKKGPNIRSTFRISQMHIHVHVHVHARTHAVWKLVKMCTCMHAWLYICMRQFVRVLKVRESACACACACMNIGTSICTTDCAFNGVSVHLYMHMYVHVSTYLLFCVHMHAYMRIYTYIHIHIYPYMNIYINTHIYIDRHSTRKYTHMQLYTTIHTSMHPYVHTRTYYD